MILLAASISVEKKEIRFELLPPGELVEVRGEKMRGYLLHEWLELAQADLELVRLRKDANDFQTIIDEQGELIESQAAIIKTLEDDKKILTRQKYRCDVSLKKCEEEVISSAAGPWWMYVVAIAGSVIGIVGATAWVVR
jgi:hypothetical protein